MIGLFERTHILVGDEGIERLKNARVVVAGMGGVGSFVAEGLARAGIGYLKLVDHDMVSASNLNRQLVALESTVGKNKAEVMAERIRDINPNCQVDVCAEFLRAEDMDAFFAEPFDFVVDAIDSLSCKVAYVRTAYEKGYQVVSSMGAGNKVDPTQIKVADVLDTFVCKLARFMRVRLRRQGVKKGVLALYSTEPSSPPLPPEPVPGLGRDRAVNGTISYMPALFGLTLSGLVVQKLIGSYVKK